jgi:hypothetical protein
MVGVSLGRELHWRGRRRPRLALKIIVARDESEIEPRVPQR